MRLCAFEVRFRVSRDITDLTDLTDLMTLIVCELLAYKVGMRIGSLYSAPIYRVSTY